MSTTRRTHTHPAHPHPAEAATAAPLTLWRMWVGHVDEVAARMAHDDAAYADGLDLLGWSARTLGANKTATVAAKGARHGQTRRGRDHVRHALRVGARLDARAAMAT